MHLQQPFSMLKGNSRSYSKDVLWRCSTQRYKVRSFTLTRVNGIMILNVRDGTGLVNCVSDIVIKINYNYNPCTSVAS